MTDYYDQEDSGWYFSAKETAFRTNAAGKDTTNGATYVYYPFPIRHVKWSLIFLAKKKVVLHLAGVGPDIGEIQHQGYDEIKLTLSGDLVDFSLMYFLCKGCTTTDNDPGAGYYTHTYINTTARVSASFQIFNKHVNPTGAQSILNLLVGCVITRHTISGSQNQNLKGTFYIDVANIVTATALTAPGYPTYRNVRILTFEDTLITFNKGGVAYDLKVTGFEWDYNDGSTLHKCAGETKPDEILMLHRTNTIRLDVIPKVKAFLDDLYGDEPTEADDIDIILKMFRNTTLDYIQSSWEKVFCIEAPKNIDYSYNNAKLQVNGVKYAAKPTWQETGAKNTITEVNQVDDDRYET